MTATIAEINAILDRTARRDAEYRSAAEKRDAEYRAEYRAEMAEMRRRMEESSAKTDAAIRKSMGHFDTQWGRLVESLCRNQVVPLLNSRGIEVHQTTQRSKTRLPTGGGYFEIDIAAINGDTVVLFEVKTTLRPENVAWFIEKLGFAREMFHQYRDCRILGGVAYLREDSEAALVAQRQGLFTILATGNGAVITNEADFAAKEW